jgi:hypothetical protein
MIFPTNNHLLIHQLILISCTISIKDIKYSRNKANLIKLFIKIFKRIAAPLIGKDFVLPPGSDMAPKKIVIFGSDCFSIFNHLQ